MMHEKNYYNSYTKPQYKVCAQTIQYKKYGIIYACIRNTYNGYINVMKQRCKQAQLVCAKIYQPYS